jgi:hydroxyacylglutathione hydrolase
MTVTMQAIPMLSDNYSWLLTESETGKIGIIDPAEAAPAIAVLEAAGLGLDMIFLTHHHPDHVGGAEELRARYGAQIVGNRADAHRLPSLDVPVHEGALVAFGPANARVIEVPGHTLGHIAYYFADGELLFAGDTMFSMGCGRLFEGTAAQMFDSFAKFSDLPDETLLCCGHEYTQSNAKFALSIEPDNAALKARVDEVARLRAAGLATLPVSLGVERATNPFIRAATAEEFGARRAAKDSF